MVVSVRSSFAVSCTKVESASRLRAPAQAMQPSIGHISCAWATLHALKGVHPVAADHCSLPEAAGWMERR